MGISYKAAAQFDGLFSPGLGRLTALWGFSGEAPRKPADDEIAEALRLSVLPPLKRAGNGTAAAFGEKPLCAFDFGAVGKGFASDAVKRLCKEANAVALINLGGNIQTVGEKPNGEPWIISVQSPLTVGPVSVGTLQLRGEWSISTSGDYQKFFYEDGVKYHHILSVWQQKNTDVTLIFMSQENRLTAAAGKDTLFTPIESSHWTTTIRTP